MNNKTQYRLAPMPEQKIIFVERTTNVTNPVIHSIHYHNFYELYFLVSGNRDYMIDDEIFSITDGAVVLIPPGHLHKTDGEKYERILVQFSASFLHAYFNDNAIEKLLFCFQKNYLRSPEAVKERFYRLLCYYEQQKHEHLFAALADLLITLAESIDDAPEKIAPRFTDERLSGIVRYIHENYSSIVNIEDVSEKFYLSKFHLCHLFKKAMGISMMSYVNKIKISSSLFFLKTTDEKITQIALECGFNAVSHFCNTFKKQMGISPAEYRISHRSAALPRD